MASGFFAILDDIAALMDDVAVNAKIAGRQTAGILGDDLAVNAEKATGFVATRELPVLWKITKGSFLNKLIILPIVFLLQFLYPPAITAILVLGGLYLAFEGMEKIFEFIFHRDEAVNAEVLPTETVDESMKVRSAITTDFILSLEIVIIALSTVMEKSLPLQILTVSIISLLATVGVYGIVALIVRMDDVGYRLIKISGSRGLLSSVGKSLIRALPMVIKILGVVGTVALLMVSGGIFDHNISFTHVIMPQWPGLVRHIIFGMIAGAVMVPVVLTLKKIWKKFAV